MAVALERETEVASGKPAARRFSFGPAILDERSLELLVQNQPVELEPKPLEVLRHLLFHAGEVVTKDEILAAVWPGRILSETVLTKCVARLREVLSDDDQQVIKTVHGYGYRLVAPVSVEVSASPTAPPRFDFKPGDHPPLRPLWSLVQRLGQGSHGEAWLVRHDKTREQRVYKFAPDSTALHALKREITLYRLLHDALGDQAPSVAALDWNLDESPYFLEIEYAPGGSLVDWSLAQNGLGQVPLSVRLEIAAQTADALAAAHSMGVLHKDLKPSNILIINDPPPPAGGGGGRGDVAPKVKLGDFGSGGVLDPARLEAMGITRMGFTQTIKAGTVGGTPLYLAPEVIAGQPATIQADIYALGVILYQLIVGDLWRPLAPGWEQDIADELLREDIAFAVEGHVERRLGTAAVLAQTLRTLDQRRTQRAAEQTGRAEAEAQRLEMQRVLAQRVWVRATIGVLVAGLTISVALFLDARRARNAATEAAETSKAVSAFLSQDMFAQIGSEQRPLKDLTLKEVLDGASMQVDKRFEGKPETAAEVHLALGASYWALDDTAGAAQHLDQALALLERQGKLGSETAADTAARLIPLKWTLGEPGLSKYEVIRTQARQQLGRQHPKVLNLSQQLAYGHFLAGRFEQSAAELRTLLGEAAATSEPDLHFVAGTEDILGMSLLQLAEYAESEKVFRSSLSRRVPLVGEAHVQVAWSRTFLADSLREQGRYAEADAEITAGLQAATQWAPHEAAGYVLRARISLGRLRTEQNRLTEAAGILEDVVKALVSHQGPEADQSVGPRKFLADVYQRQHRLDEAASQLRQALNISNSAFGPDDPEVVRVRLGLADVLREQGRLDDAWAALKGINPRAFADLPVKHPMLAQLRRVEGLLFSAEKKYGNARAALVEARDILEYRYGARHWRTERAREELARVPSGSGGQP